MVGVPLRAPKVGIFAGEGYEVHVIFWAMLGIVGRKGDDGGRTRGIVVGACIIDFLAEIS